PPGNDLGGRDVGVPGRLIPADSPVPGPVACGPTRIRRGTGIRRRDGEHPGPPPAAAHRMDPRPALAHDLGAGLAASVDHPVRLVEEPGPAAAGDPDRARARAPAARRPSPPLLRAPGDRAVLVASPGLVGAARPARRRGAV